LFRFAFELPFGRWFFLGAKSLTGLGESLRRRRWRRAVPEKIVVHANRERFHREQVFSTSRPMTHC